MDFNDCGFRRQSPDKKKISQNSKRSRIQTVIPNCISRKTIGLN